MTNYVVTGHIKKAGRRQRISHEMPLEEAQEMRIKTEREMSIATTANQWVSEIRIDGVE
jgi:hypothetical protein